MTDSRMRANRRDYRYLRDHSRYFTKKHGMDAWDDNFDMMLEDVYQKPVKGRVYKKYGRGITRFDKRVNNTKLIHLMWMDALESPKKPHTASPRNYYHCKDYSWMIW